MADPNEPRLLKPRRPETHVMDGATGDAGRDGYTRLARARVQTRPAEDPMFGEYVGPGCFDPPVGQRDYRRGPSYED